MNGTILPAPFGAIFVWGGGVIDRLLGSRLRSAVLWLTLGTVAGRAGVLLAMMLCARILGPHDFGLLTLLLSSTQLLQIFLSAGFAGIVIRFVAIYRGTDPIRAARVLALVRAGVFAMSALVLLGLALAADTVAARLFAGELSRMALWAGVIYVLLLAWAELQVAVLSALEEFQALARVQALSGPASLVAIASGAAVAGLEGAIGGMALAAGFQLCLGLPAASRAARRHAIPFRLGWSQAEFALLPTYGLPGLINALIWLPPVWLTGYLLTRQPGGYAELGVFGVANQWFLVLNFLPLMLTRAALPILSSFVGAAAHAEAEQMLRRAVTVASLLVLAPALVLILSAPLVMPLYGDAFAAGWPVMMLMCGTAVVAASNGIMQNYLLACSRPWLTTGINAVWAVILLASAGWAIERYLAIGLALAYGFAYAVKTAALFWVTARVRRYPQSDASAPAGGEEDQHA